MDIYNNKGGLGCRLVGVCNNDEDDRPGTVPEYLVSIHILDTGTVQVF